jgi:CelD/BcsL family acetyltransferase involved in cellulose biosynthesis
LKIDAVVPYELGATEIARWHQLQGSNSELANPFLSAEFAMRVGRVRPTTRVAILEEGPEIVGFFPFDLGPFHIGRPFAPGLVDCRAVIQSPELQWDPKELLRSCRLDVLELDHHLADQPTFEDHYVAHAPSPVIDVSEGYEAYLTGRRSSSKGRISSLLRKYRKLQRERGDVHFEFDSRNPEALDVLKSWKSEQYRRNARVDRFARPWITRVVEELYDTRESYCSANLSVLYADEEPIAADFSLRSSSVLASWFPGFSMDYASYSPGFLMFLKMAEMASKSSVVTIDLGKGDEEYKSVLANSAVEVAEGSLERPSAVAWARRAQRAPSRYAVNFVVKRPALRQHARNTLLRIGSLRHARSGSSMQFD